MEFVEYPTNIPAGDPNLDLAAQGITSSQQLPPEVAGGMMAFLAGFSIIMIILAIAVYIYYAICLMKIAQRTNTPNAWFAWIPILNFILMIGIAKKPMWWALALLLAFIPIANILLVVFMVYIWMEIAKAVNKPSWWGILIIVPIANLIVPGYLAFSKSQVAKPATA